MTERYANNPTTTLSAACAVGDGTITVAAGGAPFSQQGNFRIVCDNEIMLVTSVAGNVFTVSRGKEGTTAAAHSIGAAVGQILTAASHQAITSLPCEGRLTLTSGVPVTMADVALTATMYFTPFLGNRIALWDNSIGEWTVINFSEISITLPAGVSATYDVWGYLSGGNLALEVLAWSSGTTRAVGLGTQDGVYVKSGDPSRRYLGSVYALNGSVQDTAVNRAMWNYYNRRPRQLRWSDPAANWTYAAGTWRPANNNSAAMVQVMLGLVEDAVQIMYTILNSSAPAITVYVSIARNSSTTPLASPPVNGCFCGINPGNQGSTLITTLFDNTYPIGYNYWMAMEAVQSGYTGTFINPPGGLFGEAMA